jgi:thymidine kinase
MFTKRTDLTPREWNTVKKYACSLDVCGDDFVFNTTEGLLAADTAGINVYQAVCNKCGKKSLMTKAAYSKWNKLYTGGEVVIKSTTFDDFFEED